MLNHYFQRPLFWDYLFASFVSIFVAVLYHYKKITLPKDDYIMSTASDLATISLTLAGFILTLFTVLISFKSSTATKKDINPENNTVFELFFSSPLYFKTIAILKNCIKSLVALSIISYLLKLGVRINTYKYMYVFNYWGVVVVAMTLGRSLLILTEIVKIQQNE